jgi:hypothetical protein
VSSLRRVAAAGISVILAVVSGVVTALVTAYSSLGLWVALGALVLVGGGLQAAVTASDRRSTRRVLASGAGAVAIRGSAGEVRTRVQWRDESGAVTDGDGVIATGPGAVSIGGDSAGPVSTDVTNAGDQDLP